ncbi:MAG: AI-2E family transporter [Flavobacterium sp.]|nr:MAG: AI-2E family transporter [Flavobacterium sp.]
MNQTLKFPFYARLSLLLICLIAIWCILYFGQGIIIPLLLAVVFSILLNPIKNFLQKSLRFPHVLASLFSVILFVAFFAAVIFFLSWQITDMISDWGKMKHNLALHISHLQQMITDNFDLTRREQNKFINSTASDTGKELVGSTLMSLSDTLLSILLVLIYTFLLILYQAHLMKFLVKLITKEHHAKLKEILLQIKISVQGYIVGLFIEMILVSVLTAVGFMIIGVEYAWLLGCITGILNVIPYIGILIAGVLSILVSLSGSSDVSIALGVIGVNIIVQFIDNNFITTMIVSSKVQLNALVSIVGIIIGGVLGGIGGMFLAIPLMAIMKVIFDRIEGLSPWGYLLGDDMPKTFRWHKIQLPLFSNDKVSTTVPDIEPSIKFTETTTQPDPNKPPTP